VNVAVLIFAIFVAACALVVIASSRHKKSSRAPLHLVGRVGTIERDLEPEGAVLVCGELFPARTRTGEKILRASGTRVRVVGARAHFLEVEREDSRSGA
jgi:membrane protein implicated in regulation of membrane protease activity